MIYVLVFFGGAVFGAIGTVLWAVFTGPKPYYGPLKTDRPDSIEWTDRQMTR